MSVPPAALEELETYLGPRSTRDACERLAYSHDAGAPPALLRRLFGLRQPEAVVRPQSEDDLAWLLAWARRHRVPLTPRAAGTSGYGGALPVRGGVVVDLTALTGVTALDVAAQTVTVRAGTVWQALERALEPQGLALRTYPSSAPASTVGGSLAQGGVGYGAWEYGAVEESVAGTSVLLPNGEVCAFREGELGLVAGACGTTGIILEVTLRVRARQRERVAGAVLANARSLAAWLQALWKSGAPIWSVSFGNATLAALKNRLPAPHAVAHAPRAPLPEAYICLAVAPGERWQEVEAALERAHAIAGGRPLPAAMAQQEWDERCHTLQIKALGPSLIPAEAAVPLANLAPALEELARTVRAPLALEGLVARAASGPEVTLLGFSPHDERLPTYTAAYALSLLAIEAVKRHGGRTYTTGRYFTAEAAHVLDGERLAKLWAFKKDVDPLDLMNPGKVFPAGWEAWALCVAQAAEPLLRPLANLAGRGRPAVEGNVANAGEVPIIWNALVCARCGECVDGCPQHYGRGWEGQAPRGKWTLLRHNIPPEGTGDRFFACTLCGRCSQVCPVGIDHRAAWLDIRGQLARAGLLPAALAGLKERLVGTHNLAGLEPAARLAWCENLPEPARAALNQGPADVAYFVGCVSSLYPQGYGQAQALVQLLQKAGLRVAVLGSQEWCCGLPLLAAGCPDEARTLAQHNLEAVRRLGVRELVFTCPSCLQAWRQDYPRLTGGDTGMRLRHAVELLADLVDGGSLRPALPAADAVTYHDPCDLGRGLGVFEPPRRLLRAMPGLDLREMADSGPLALCCGGGGDVEVGDPELVAKAADRRLAQALATGAGILASACPQCKRTLGTAARRMRAPLRVLDVVEMLWHAVGDETG